MKQIDFFSLIFGKQKPVYSWPSFICVFFFCLFVYKKVKVKRKWKAVGGWPGDTSLLLLCTAHCSVGPRWRPNNHVRICVWHFCSCRVFFMDEPVFFSLMGKTSSSSFLIPFGSGLEAPSMHPIFLSRRGTIYEEDKFYWSLMICDLIIFSNCNCLSWFFMIWCLRVHSNESIDFNKLAVIVGHLRKDSDLLSFSTLCHKMSGWHDL